jgi:hypothetical protein
MRAGVTTVLAWTNRVLMSLVAGAWWVAACLAPVLIACSGRLSETASDASFIDRMRPADAGIDGSISLTCPTTLLARAVPFFCCRDLIWWGAGYTLLIDENVAPAGGDLGQTFFETTDATGALLAGPTPVTPSDGVSRHLLHAAFSGTEYGITHNESQTTTFMRTDAHLVPIAGSTVTLGTTNFLGYGGDVNIAAVAWSHQRWGVAWGVESGDGMTTTLYFRTFDARGAPVAPAQILGPGGLSDNGTPMIATSAGWAILASGALGLSDIAPAILYEIDVQGNVRSVRLPFNALRASLASNGTMYGVVADHIGRQKRAVTSKATRRLRWCKSAGASWLEVSQRSAAAWPVCPA